MIMLHVLIDFSKTFDSISHSSVIVKIPASLSLPHQAYKWIVNYLNDITRPTSHNYKGHIIIIFVYW